MYLLVKGADSELFREKLLAAGAAEAVAKALVKFSEVRSPSYQPDSVCVTLRCGGVFHRWSWWRRPVAAPWWCCCCASLTRPQRLPLRLPRTLTCTARARSGWWPPWVCVPVSWRRCISSPPACR